MHKQTIYLILDNSGKAVACTTNFTDGITIEQAKENLARFLYNEAPPVLKRVQFAYYKQDGSAPTWRELDVTEETPEHLFGVEVSTGELKKFLKNRIVGGEILPA